MDALGIVVAVENDSIRVKIPRESACGGKCTDCRMCDKRDAYFTAPNTVDVKIGDKVRLLADDKAFLKRAAVGYLSLAALMIVGGIIGSIAGGNWSAFCGAIVALFCGLAIFRKRFRNDIGITVIKM